MSASTKLTQALGRATTVHRYMPQQKSISGEILCNRNSFRPLSSSPNLDINSSSFVSRHFLYGTSERYFSSSSESPGFFERMRGTFSDKTDKKKQEQMKEQLLKMSNYEGMYLY